MKSFASPSKYVANRDNGTLQRAIQPVKTIVNNRPSAVAQQKLQQSINNKSSQVEKKWSTSKQTSTEQIIQAKWALDDVLNKLRESVVGVEALMRLKNNQISISHQAKNGSFNKVDADVANNLLVDRANPSGMDGFGAPKIIYISDEVDVSHAAAMIVHESTHSIQKVQGGICYEWTKIPDAALKAAKKQSLELEMELEAHLNQFEFELEINQVSDKCKQCLDATGAKIDKAKVEAMIKTMYGLAPPANLLPLEQQAVDESRTRRNKMLNDFTDKANTIACYDWATIKQKLTTLQHNKPISQAITNELSNRKAMKKQQAATTQVATISGNTP